MAKKTETAAAAAAAATTDEKKPQSAFDDGELGTDDVGEGEKVSTKFAGPLWAPQLRELNEKRAAKELATLRETNARSTMQEKIVGTLRHMSAYGREVYGVEVKAGDEVLCVKLPEHTTLYNALALVKRDHKVKIVYLGPAETGSPGKQPPILYDVIAETGAKLLSPRADALKIEKRKEEPKKADDKKADGMVDDDLPF